MWPYILSLYSALFRVCVMVNLMVRSANVCITKERFLSSKVPFLLSFQFWRGRLRAKIPNSFWLLHAWTEDRPLLHVNSAGGFL